MIRNYLVTALRNLKRNWLYGAISILGLAAAFTAAILIVQFVRGEFSYDRWIPGYQQVYKIANTLMLAGQPPIEGDMDQGPVANQLKAVLPSALAIARLRPNSPPIKHRPEDAPATENAFAWADPDIFKVFPLPALAGDLTSALQQPDTVVITRRMARKYFHRDQPIGDTLLIEAPDRPPPGAPPQSAITRSWHPMRVTAVLRDLPSNTNLATEVFASSRTYYSDLAWLDSGPPALGLYCCFTYVRLSPKTSLSELQRALDVATRPESAAAAKDTPGSKWLFHSVPLADVHLIPPGRAAGPGKPVGSRAVAFAIAGVGALIVLVAAINFVTLMTALAARRGIEVGVRKATGAGRGDLMVQFIGEALIQVALAAMIATLLAELLLPAFSAFVQRGLTLNFFHDPVLLAGVGGVALIAGLLAAIYPALVLSSFRPAAVLKGGVVQASGSPIARASLVVVQFAILVGLIVTTATIYRQTRFALAQGLGAADSQRIVTVAARCDTAFSAEVRKLPGVARAACSTPNALNSPNSDWQTTVQSSGRRTSFAMAPLDFGFFELYGVKPLAGRLFLPDHGEDRVLADPKTTAMPTVILNETASRQLGFPDPRAAIGRSMTWSRPGMVGSNGVPLLAPSNIIGVVPDTPVTVRAATQPMIYFVWPQRVNTLSIRMSGQDIPGTLKAIDAAWKRTGNTVPIVETFLSQSNRNLYFDLITQGTTIGISAALAVLIACLGLFALSAFITERRTKEIGVRKAMGADTRQLVFLLLWQFTIPVLVASAVAIPVGVLAMRWWLGGFVYHVSLSPWTFALAAAAAVAIAWATVSWQSFTVARAKPATALRYE